MSPILILLLKYKYLILIPLAAFEGPVVALMVGGLVFAGVFNFWISYIILLFGDIVPDTIFYFIGYFGQQSKFIQKYFLKSKFFINHQDIVKKLWMEHTFKIMFFGKLAYGMALPFLITAGIVKLKYKKFIAHSIPVTLFQYGALMTIGYYMGSSFALALKYVDYAYFLMAGIVILFIIVYLLVIKYARKEIILIENQDLNI